MRKEEIRKFKNNKLRSLKKTQKIILSSRCRSGVSILHLAPEASQKLQIGI